MTPGGGGGGGGTRRSRVGPLRFWQRASAEGPVKVGPVVSVMGRRVRHFVLPGFNLRMVQTEGGVMDYHEVSQSLKFIKAGEQRHD